MKHVMFRAAIGVISQLKPTFNDTDSPDTPTSVRPTRPMSVLVLEGSLQGCRCVRRVGEDVGVVECVSQKNDTTQPRTIILTLVVRFQ